MKMRLEDIAVGSVVKLDYRGYATLPKQTCGARTRKGEACIAPSMPNGRCRMHGGLSTGPKTPEGKQRSLDALSIGRERLRKK